MSPERRRGAQLAGALAVVVVLVLLYPDFVRQVTNHAPRRDDALPLSFAGNRAAYGFALFSLFTITALAVRKLWDIGCQLREADWRENPDIGLYRMAVGALMLTIIFGAGPDVAYLLMFNEATKSTLSIVLTIDRIGDGVTIAPFLAAIAFGIRADQLELVPLERHRAALDDLAMTPRDRAFYIVLPQRDGLIEQSRIVAFVGVIALGLAVLK